MPSADGSGPAEITGDDGSPDLGGGAPGPRVVRRWLRRVVAVVVIAVVGVGFARGTLAEVRYQADPEGRPPLDQQAVDAAAGDRAGTGCGGWPALLSTTGPPATPALHGAVWADAAAFHVRSDHLFVVGVRVDVEGGTAESPGLEPSGSLTIPTRSGQTVDVEISCGATAATVHLVGGDGKDVADAVLGLGAQPGAPTPLRLVKTTEEPPPAVCRELLELDAKEPLRAIAERACR